MKTQPSRLLRPSPLGRFGTAVVAVALGGIATAGCKKDPAPPATTDESKAPAMPAPPAPAGGAEASNEPIPGIDLSKLEEEQRPIFDKLVNSLGSPCGDARSLRSAALGEGGCKRASTAARFVFEMLIDGASEADAREFYGLVYKDIDKKVGFKLSDAVPHQGPSDARVVIVEFYDYGCPACKQFKPVLEGALEAYPRDVVIYYKQYPLPGHPDSDEAAAAALAAHEQGKFAAMHELLFANQQAHKMEDLEKYAAKIGLDMAKFRADFKKAVVKVAADKAEGGANVQGTPTIFINGHSYQGPPVPKYFNLFIDEELAVNQ